MFLRCGGRPCSFHGPSVPVERGPIMSTLAPSRLGLPGAILLAGLLVTAASASAATPKRALETRRGELRERIDALRHDLAKSEETRDDAADRLRETESAISDANRSLRRLGERRASAQAELADLESQSRRLAEHTTVRQRQLSGLLHRRFTRGDADAWQLLLGGHDPNLVALDRHFLKRLSIAQADVIADLRDQAREKQRLGEAARAKNTELDAIARQQEQARTVLLEQQRQRQVLLAQVAERIKAQRREIGTLRRDEQRLARLIEDLARAAKTPRRQANAAATASRTKPPAEPAVAPPTSASSNEVAVPRGRLMAPVRGEIVGRFGRPRPDGGPAWKGLFIRAAEGAEVHAVATGTVVHADWLRGFGNLMVVDHGDGLLSVYGNNQSLLKETGQGVKAGEVIATVGDTGGLAQSGLYFELRQQGQAVDPLRWVNLR